ncbi:hypothetical protein COLO4_34664 [Corchorus olitorius]|uniref:Uncharacterized protein n=1 Tax=Corchorus olitorius TaxID=93759 RepID=A0A1R3GJZ8_9ROSI|nr:hypothetical protein COLO4_34664 [Corchorus olitorius]
MGRSPCCEKVGLKRGRWTAEEDELLTKYIQANGEGSWRSLPKNAAAGESKRRGGRTSRSAMKRHKLALMSLNICPRSINPNEVSESTPQQNINSGGQKKDDMTKLLLQPEKQDTDDSATESSIRRNVGKLHGSCMNSSASSGQESWVEKEVQQMGPNEWLDSEIKRLSTKILQQQSSQGGVDLRTTSRENGSIDHDDGAVQKGAEEKVEERESSNHGGAASRNSLGFDDHDHHQEDWLHWDFASASASEIFDHRQYFHDHDHDESIDDDDQWKLLWDDSDKLLLCWLRDDGNGDEAAG